MYEQVSQIAHLRQQIALEHEAAQRGLSGLASVATHESITARMERGAERILKLAHEGKHEEAQALLLTERGALKSMRSRVMSKRMVVVEPSRILRKLLEVSFQRDGHQLVVFEDYGTARHALTSSFLLNAPPDVVVASLNPALETSMQVAAVLKVYPSYTCTMLIALVAQEDVRVLTRMAQVTDAALVLKPFCIQDIVRLITPSAAVPLTPSEIGV